MTIRERYCNQGEVGVDAIRVYCNHLAHHLGSKLIWQIHHGYDGTKPISKKEIKKAYQKAKQHERCAGKDHSIDIVIFTKNE